MKQKILLLALLLLTVAETALAQQFVVTGTARNAKSQEPVEFVNAVVLRNDTAIVANRQTDANGHFRLTVGTPGKYTLRLSYLGYDTHKQTLVLVSGRDSIDVGDVLLNSREQVLGTAVVTATAAKVEQKEDTTVFNAAAYRVPEGSTLEALVKQLPGVEVSDDGTITWNGKEVKEFLVNGKDFFKGDTKVAMKNLPTELISKLKAYDKKSDYAEETGIDDGEETTVLDIATKRELNESWVSNIDLAYGTKDRYAEKFFATRFTDTSRITAFGSANNTGDQGFGAPRGFGSGSQGLTASKMAGIDFSWENKKKKTEAGRLELGGNVRYNHTSNDLVSATASETFLTGGSKSSFANSRTISDSHSTGVNAALRLKWCPDSMTSVTLRPSFSHNDSRNGSNVQTGTFNDDPYQIDGMFSPLDSLFLAAIPASLEAIAVNRTGKESMGDSKSNSVNVNLNVTRRLGSNGRNVSLRVRTGWAKSESNSFSISNIKYFDTSTAGNAKSFLNQYSTTPGKNWNYSVGLGYVEPIVKKLYAEFRYNYAYKYNDSQRSRYNLDSLFHREGIAEEYWAYGDADNHPLIGALPTEADVLSAVLDLNNSQYATYKYFNHSASAGIRYNTDAVRFNASVSFNPEKTQLEYNRPAQLDTIVTRNVFNVSPQIRFRYLFSKTDQLEVFYRGSSSQPSMTNLLNVIDDSDPLNVSMGNPGLKPAWTNSMRAMYRGYNTEKQMGLMGSIDFSATRNSISNMMVYDEATGVRYTRPENISGNWNTNGRFMINAGLGEQKLFTINSFTNFGFRQDVGYVSLYDRAAGAASAAEAMDWLVKRIDQLDQDITNSGRMTLDDYDLIFRNSNAQKNHTQTFTAREHLRADYRTGIFDIGFIGNVDYQHSRSKLQSNYNMDTWNFSYGATANVTFDWGMSLSTDIRMSSRRGYADASMNTNELLWNAQISQSFLKNKALTVTAQFYDILGQQSSVSRTISAQMRSDSWTNAIHSYCMFHVIYKLNIFGGSAKGKQQEDSKAPQQMGPGGRPAMPAPPMRMGGGMGGFGGGRF